MHVERYLGRLGIEAPPELSLAGLANLQVTHLETVPFENLDIAAGRPLSLSPEALLEKVVEQRRGGFCYELNGVFACLLEALGFEVVRVAGRVTDDDGAFGPPADHLALLVTVESGTYLVDVGFGDGPRRPLALSDQGRADAEGSWRATPSSRPDADYVVQRNHDGEWVTAYSFTTTPRDLSFFRATFEYHQRAPESPFTDGPLVTLARPDGRATLSAETLTVTVEGETEERAVDRETWYEVLESTFGMPPASVPEGLP